jgi:excinuclease ABC subunit A
VIEHNLDVIKTADWVIDMGPEGGSRGGMVIAEGTPEQIASNGDSYTGVYLKPILDGRFVPVGSIQPELLPPPAAPTRKGAARKATAKTVAAKTIAAKTAAAKKVPAEKAPRRAPVKKTTARAPARKAS